MCRSVSESGEYAVTVIRTGDQLDYRVRVLLERSGVEAVIFSDDRDRKPVSCDVRWIKDPNLVLVYVKDMVARPIDIAYGLNEGKLLAEPQVYELRRKGLMRNEKH